MNILKKYLTIMLLLGLTCPATACNSSSSSEDEVPPHLKPENPEEPVRDYYPKTDGATRLVTYNVGVFTKYVSDGSYQMIADMMTEGKADLVGISELDSCTVRTGRVFQLKKFAELMGKEWSYEYSRAMAYQGGAYGDGIASREKPVRAFAAPLPKGDGAEPRVMVSWSSRNMSSPPPTSTMYPRWLRQGRSMKSTRSSNENSAARRNPSSSAATSTPVPIRPPFPN